MAPYGLVGWCHCTGRPYCFHLQSRRLDIGSFGTHLPNFMVPYYRRLNFDAEPLQEPHLS
jgi:hypothetical protein